MSTERLYREDPYIVSVKSTIMEVRTEKNGTLIVLDRTIFFPEGGGQPSDIGELTCQNGTVYEVTDVYDESLAGDVYHVVDAPQDALSVGDVVTIELDWDRRFTNMQRHAGEHVLSGAIHRLYSGTNKGFHMGDDYITIDVDMNGALLSPEQIAAAELEANRVIWNDVPIVTQYFVDAEAASSLPVRKPVDIEGEISVVVIGDEDDPADCVACCGTHPDSTGQIGLIKIYKHEPNKGMTRIYFDCGSRAFERCRTEMRILTDIANGYSTNSDTLPHKLEVERERSASLKARLSDLMTYYRTKSAHEMTSEISRCSDDSLVISHHTEIAGADDLLKLGFDVLHAAAESKDHPANLLILLIQEKDNTVILVSQGSYDCGAIVKEYAPASGGKGGGRNDNARAVFQNHKDMIAFISAMNSL